MSLRCQSKTDISNSIFVRWVRKLYFKKFCATFVIKSVFKFWPLYNEFSQKRQELRNEYSAEKAKLNMETATEAQKRALLDFGLNLKERNVALEKTYSSRMLSIITSDQILSLRKAEDDFRKMMLQQIQKRRQQRQERRDQNRDRANERQQQRRNN